LLPWDVLREQAKEIESEFIRIGLTPDPRCRVSRYVSLLRDAPKFDEQTTHRTLHYRIDVRMLRTILRQLSDDPAFRPLLRELLSGPEQRQAMEKSSSRDIQFQLYVAAVLRRARFEVRNQEPDVGVIVGHHRLAVACKRIRSPKKLVTRVKEGIQQIKRTGLQGWVALDLTLLAAEPHELPVNESSRDLSNIPELYIRSVAHQLLEISELARLSHLRTNPRDFRDDFPRC
jgi:hypothetical protein